MTNQLNPGLLHSKEHLFARVLLFRSVPFCSILLHCTLFDYTLFCAHLYYRLIRFHSFLPSNASSRSNMVTILPNRFSTRSTIHTTALLLILGLCLYRTPDLGADAFAAAGSRQRQGQCKRRCPSTVGLGASFGASDARSHRRAATVTTRMPAALAAATSVVLEEYEHSNKATDDDGPRKIPSVGNNNVGKSSNTDNYNRCGNSLDVARIWAKSLEDRIPWHASSRRYLSTCGRLHRDGDAAAGIS